MTGCTVGGKATPIRIHGLLDDASRHVVALEAHTTEKEVDMLGMTVDAPASSRQARRALPR
ncbi:hypothetical protein BE17_38110 [Sorangium cellulosum]|uniref:Transposase n=1 Tax=Sorangium cellulosum TaxID=56 RepID=A0A150S449_SORCE|nr:hypothetical protein BE17_38110 [Sorangium cellulosum]